MKWIIRTEKLTKSFGDLIVLDEVDLEVYPGENVVILGGSGSGKSVLLQTLVGLLPADSGKIWLHGCEVTHFRKEKDWYPVRLKTGFLFQTGGLYDSMTVYENIAFAMRHHLHLTEREIKKRVEKILAAVQLKGVEAKYPAELSGGMQKRVGLARAFSLNPPLILYDEPTTGLDPIRGDAISELIRHLQKTYGISAIIVTHDLSCAFKVADKIMLLYQGKIVLSGTVEEIEEAAHPYMRQFFKGLRKSSPKE
jgi:phospholipid/cholesterol/gamma-HCH transport system ATP-binding protein